MLCDETALIEDVETLIALVNEANKLYIHGVIAKAGMIALRDKMKETMESIELGRVYVDQEFLRSVLRDTEAGPGFRVFIRRIFPIQDERDASMKDILVTEATLGRTLSHIDDCHVLVIQCPGARRRT